MGDFINLLSCADVFTPLAHIIQDWRVGRGNVSRFVIDSQDAIEYRNILDKRKIKSWGWYYYAPKRQVVFSVHKRHADLVAYLLGF